MSAAEPRLECPRCRRPLGVCFCQHITPRTTRTRLILLQHPRERRMGIGTARFAHLALPDSALRVDVDFSTDPVVRAALAGPAPNYVLFPGPGALAAEELPAEGPLTLFVVDGTWSQARKLLRLNPAIAALPRVAFTPRRPSGYLIRKQPAEFCVSTIEALAEVLGALEPGRPSFDSLLAPFHAMVERQRWYMTEVRSQRHRRADRPKRPSKRALLAARIAAAWPRLVCVQGEANAWARRDPQRQDPEIIHWLAHRPATGERFEAVIAPRRPLGPGTPDHVALAVDRLRGGISVDEWKHAWAGFAHADDELVAWGNFYRELAVDDGLPLPATGMDARAELSRFLGRGMGAVEEAAAALGATPVPLGLDGRGGRRLAALTGVVTLLAAEGRDAQPGSSAQPDLASLTLR